MSGGVSERQRDWKVIFWKIKPCTDSWMNCTLCSANESEVWNNRIARSLMSLFDVPTMYLFMISGVSLFWFYPVNSPVSVLDKTVKYSSSGEIVRRAKSTHWRMSTLSRISRRFRPLVRSSRYKVFQIDREIVKHLLHYPHSTILVRVVEQFEGYFHPKEDLVGFA